MDAVWKNTKARSGSLLVLLALADFSNDQGIAFPSIPTLARKARLSPRQVKRAIDQLHRLGELIVYKKKGPNGVNRYIIIPGDNLSPGIEETGLKVTYVTSGGDILGTKVVTPTSPNPSNPSGNLGGEVIRQNVGLGPISETVLEIIKKYEKAGLLEGSC